MAENENEKEVSEDVSKLSINAAPAKQDLAPIISTDGIVAFDITEKFHAAASTLAPGELVKDGYFTLFESVAALEIMDPKMDSGCVEADQSPDDEHDTRRVLLPEEVLGVIDQMLCHEMAWHLGYPLSQTLFTNVYIEALLMPTPATLDEAYFGRSSEKTGSDDPMMLVLRAYCLGLLKACGWVNERIMQEHYYEEEDFVTSTYSRSLLEHIEVASIKTVLEEARETLVGLASSVPSNIIRALDLRLQLRTIFLDGADLSQHRGASEVMRAKWQSGFDLLLAISSSHPLGKPVPEAFSEKLQRKLASTMPPRPIVQLSFEDAFGHLTRLFSDTIEVIGILAYTDIQCLQTFLMTFQAKKEPPLVFVRTMLQAFILKDDIIVGSKSVRDAIDDDLFITVLPYSKLLDPQNAEIEVPHDPRHIIHEQMGAFRERAKQPFADLLRTFCQNRCRVRRTLCHVVQDWENLQVDAEEADQIMQAQTREQPLVQENASAGKVESFQLPLSSWAYLYKLRQMAWIVQLGFELEIYQADELAGMYWYLNYLAKTRVGHVERIHSFHVRALNEARERAKGSSGSLSDTDEARFFKAFAFSKLGLLEAAVTWELADALSCVYAVLGRLGLVGTATGVQGQQRPYGTGALRHELRMRPFAGVGLPALPTPDEFARGTLQADVATADVLAYAERAAAGARKGFEHMAKLPAAETFSVGSEARWLAGVRNGLKSCIATSLVVSAVRAAVDRMAAGGGDGKLGIRVEIPTPDKAYHEWWIIPKIIPV